jgi:hypothetical protein
MALMKRLVAVLGALTVGALLVPGIGLASGPPRAGLHAFSCVKAIDPVNRSVGVTAVMRPLAGTRHMAVKFDLLVSHGRGTPVRALHAGDLGSWVHPSTPTLGQLRGDVWNLQKRVVALHAPAVYRFRVHFRWQGARGPVIGAATRYSRRCSEPELRPDLVVRSIAVAADPNHPDQDQYTATIANTGNSGAGPFDVLFATADGSTTATHTVSLLRAHSSRIETFSGPVCSSADTPTITADSADQVDDLNRSNNALQATCPS